MTLTFSSRETRRYVAHRKEVTGVAFSGNGLLLAAAGDASVTYVFDVEHSYTKTTTERWLHECKGHSKNIERVSWNPADSKQLVTVGGDKLINFYDLRSSSTPVKSFTAENGCLNLAWSPDSSCVLVSDREDKFYRIETRSWEMTSNISFGGEINQFQWNKKGDRMYLARGDGKVEVISWPSMRSLAIIGAHMERCFAIACDHEDRSIAVTSEDSCVSVWDAQELVNLFTIDRSETTTRLASYSHNGEVLALTNNKSGIHLADATSGRLLAEIPTSAPVNSIHWHPQKPLLAYSLDRNGQRDRYVTPDASPSVNIWGYMP